MIITELYTFPVKSLAGIQSDGARILATGFETDRQWMVVEPGGAFMTQRSCPQMALVQTALRGDRLVLSTFGMEDIEVAPPSREHCGRMDVEVWGDRVHAMVHGDEINAWLSDALGRPCKLVFFPPSETRTCDPEVSLAGDSTLFSDSFPLLLTTRVSLEDLNHRLDDPVGMERFRPNIVVDGRIPYEEDGWRQLEVNGIRLRFARCCGRCSVPTVNPATGMIEGPEPIRTLSGYRTGRDGEVCFGINLIPEAAGTVRTGDKVTVAR